MISNNFDDWYPRSAVNVLGKLGLPETVAPLKALLDNESSVLLPEILEALGEIGDNRAVDSIISFTNSRFSQNIREEAVSALGSIGDRSAESALKSVIRNDSSPEIRIKALWALYNLEGEIDAEFMRDLLQYEKDNLVRYNVEWVLGKLGDKDVLESMIDRINNSPIEAARGNAAIILSNYHCKSAINALVKVQETDESRKVRCRALEALADIVDSRNLDMLINAFEKDPENNSFIAWSLRSINSDKFDNVLKAARIKGCVQAAISLGYRRGGEDLVEARIMAKPSNFFWSYYRLLVARACWGDLQSLAAIMPDFRVCGFRLDEKLIKRMPDCFPKYDPCSKYYIDNKQNREIWKWFRKNRSRLAWDAKKRRYYLKPEGVPSGG